MFLTAAGVIVGGTLAAGTAGVLKSLLWGVRPLDTRTFFLMGPRLFCARNNANLGLTSGLLPG